MVNQTVVILKGSRSDREFCSVLESYLESEGLTVIQRTASAHRTPFLVHDIIHEYSASSEVVCFITVAGASDALSGAVAANTDKLVIAYPPDLEKYGEAKVFSSTKLPRGINVHLAHNPHEVLEIIKEQSSKPTYNADELAQRRMKVVETYFTDNQDRGIETPLGLPLFKKGKTRDVYNVGDKLLINSSDRISAFDVNSATEIEGKGASLNLLSAWWFKESGRVFPNHFIGVPDITMMLAKKAERIDIEWVLRNYLYGSLYREYERGERNLYGYRLPGDLKLAEKLPEVMLTPTTKADVGHDVPITKYQAIEAELVTREDWRILEEACYKLYEFYSNRAEKKGLIIPDFKIEFGRWEGNLIQIDEAPNHDSARIWIKKYYKVGERQEGWCADKEFYRQFLIDSGVKPSDPPDPLPEIPAEVAKEIQKRLKVYEVFVKDESLDSFLLRNLESVESELRVKK